MTGIQKVKEILIALAMIAAAIGITLSPEYGMDLVLLVMIAVCLLDGLRTIVYYFSMARFMVAGQLILYRGIIELDLGFLMLFLSDSPSQFVFAYLLGFYFLSGIFKILRARESKKLGSRWRLKLTTGISQIAISICCIIFIKDTEVLIYIFCFGLVYSAILRIINALKKTAVAYIQ